MEPGKQFKWWKTWAALGLTFGSAELIFNAFFGRFPIFAVRSYSPLVVIPVGGIYEIFVWVFLAVLLGLITEIIRRIFKGSSAWHLGVELGAVLALEVFLVRSLLAVGFRDGLFRNMPTPWGDDKIILIVIAVVILSLVPVVAWIRRRSNYGLRVRDNRNLVLVVFFFAAGYSLIYNRWMSTTDWPQPSAKPWIAFALAATILVGFISLRKRWTSIQIALRLLFLAVVSLLVLTIWFAVPSGDSRPNIIVTLWDAARSGRMSMYGYEKTTTPELEKLAPESLVFEAAYSPSNYTYPSHVTFFTGKSYREHNYHGGYHGDVKRYKAEEYTLPQRLKEAGYYSALFVENSWVYAVDEGFDEVRYLPILHTYPNWGSSGCEIGILPPLRKYLNPYLGRMLVDAICYWIDGYYKYTLDEIQFRLVQELFVRCNRTGPFFLFWNWMTVHNRYHPYTEWPVGEEVENYDLAREYDLAIHYADRRFMRLYHRLKQYDKLDNTFLILTSDHGEFLGEARIWGHNKALFEPVLRVPLLIRYPSLQPGRIEEPISLTKFWPLIVLLAESHGKINSEEIKKVLTGNGKIIAEHGYLPEEWSKEYKWSYTVIEGNRQYVYDPLIPTYHSSFPGDQKDYLFKDLYQFSPDRDTPDVQKENSDLRRYYLDYLKKLSLKSRRSVEPGEKSAIEKKMRALGYLQ